MLSPTGNEVRNGSDSRGLCLPLTHNYATGFTLKDSSSRNRCEKDGHPLTTWDLAERAELKLSVSCGHNQERNGEHLFLTSQ